MAGEVYADERWKQIEHWSLAAMLVCPLGAGLEVYLASYGLAAALVVATIIALLVYRFARRQAFGWLVDSQGERQ